MKLRSYQKDILEKVVKCKDNCVVQLDTGGGKTPIIAALTKRFKHVIVVAHRNILITQASSTLASFGIHHDILATKTTRRRCELEHRKIGGSHYSPGASKYVGSIDSIISRERHERLSIDRHKPYLILIDEGHHVQAENKWGKLLKIFPNSRLVGFTATPDRTCGADEGMHTSRRGVYESLIQAEELKVNSVRTLIAKGFICDFEAYSLEPNTEFNSFEKRHIIGQRYSEYTIKAIEEWLSSYKVAADAIENYKRRTPGKQAVVFCVRIEYAIDVARQFKASGVSSAVIHSKMSSNEVIRIFELFKLKVINVLVSVDMIEEGVDVPGIEVLILLRKTSSLIKYRQWCGRGMRTEQGKEKAIIFDHVGNVLDFDLPDRHIDWDLLSPQYPYKSNLTRCSNRKCLFLYKAYELFCPKCGTENLIEPSGKEDVDEDKSYYKYIDFDLVRVKRKAIKKQYEYENTIQVPLGNIGAGAINEACKKLREWFIDQLQPDIKVSHINDFLKSKDSMNPSFWINHFVIADTARDNKSKCKKVYKKWLNSQ